MHDIVNATLAVARSFRLSASEERALGRDAARHQELVDRFGDAVRSGAHSNARTLAETAIRSSSAKVSGEIRRYRGTDLPRPSFQELHARAVNVRLSSALNEPARLRMEPKWGGGWRPILAFGQQHRVLHTICADLLKAALPQNPHEYNRSRRGDDRMTLAIAATMRERELDHVVSVDVRNCFGTVRKEDVASLLPLPRWMTNRIVLVSDAKRIIPWRKYSDAPIASDEAARAGLPQGASVSSLILSRAIFGPLLATTPFADVSYLYGDNFFVLARGRAEADARLGTLSSLLANSPAGPLTIGSASIRHSAEKINLLKNACQPIPTRYGGGSRFVPSERSFQNFTHKAQDKMRAAPPDREMEILDQYRENWLAAFPLWQGNATTEQYMRNHANMALVLMGIRPAIEES